MHKSGQIKTCSWLSAVKWVPAENSQEQISDTNINNKF